MVELVQLVDNNLNSKFMLQKHHWNLEKDKKIDFYGFDEIDKNDLREKLYNLYMEKGITIPDSHFYGKGKFQHKQIPYKKVLKAIDESKEDIEDSKFWNYHKDRWLVDLISFGAGALAGFYTQSIMAGILSFGALEGLGELGRRDNLRINKNQLKELEEIKNNYENFFYLIQDSKIDYHISEEAGTLILRTLAKKKKEDLFIPNIPEINRKLKEELYGFKNGIDLIEL
jgi:hypothetical protein